MSALFDFRTITNIIAYPIRFAIGGGANLFESKECASRVPLVMRWRRGEDGKLESRWTRED
jgi:hypothetical protein